MRSRPVKPIMLGLQGGGSHGAFTWGVLDRLLEDERIEIDAISGNSAGALNAVVLADGLMAGGRLGAREALRRFWSTVSNASGRGPMVPAAIGAFFGNWAIEGSPLHMAIDWFSRSISPYQFNPLDINPLRDIVAAEVDFERVRACDKIRLFVSATNVRTGRLKQFPQTELSVDAVMASACLPLLFRAVEIDGEAYWDGGYLGNPSLLPLIAESNAHDLVLVQIDRSRNDSLPTTAQAILDRLEEIRFNSGLVKELRSLALLQQLLRQTGVPAGDGTRSLFPQVAALRTHRIEAEAELAGLDPTTMADTGWPFLSRLHRFGYLAAQAWLETNFAHLGHRSTMSLEPFLG